MDEVPKKKITLEGLRNAFKLYSYIKPFRIEYGLGIFFLMGSSLASLAFPKLLGELVDSGNRGNLARDLIIALVGSSGAGKTTMASLIMRFHEPTSGELLFDGRKSREFSLSAVKSQIELVPQDVFLFGGSIRENISYGRPSASENDIIEAANKANALEFIDKFPGKFDTLVGERGTQLSGGQRQRIAIARAVLKNPRILILDEATSSLDSESERLVQDALEKLMLGRTSIVIAHRLSTIRKADQIMVINGGRIVEKGTHEQLMVLENGIYRNLSMLQFAV